MKKHLFSLSMILLICLFSHSCFAENEQTLYLPASTYVIEQEAFANAANIDHVILPDGITEIHNRAFADSSVTEITLPASLQYIADDAFENCKDIEITVQEYSYAHTWCINKSIAVNILPESIAFVEEPPAYLRCCDVFYPNIEVTPATTVPNLVWTSSNPDVLKIDSETGKMTALSCGTAKITVVSTRNPALKLSHKITVLERERCLTMPAQQTMIGQIAGNMNQIRKVRNTAFQELEILRTLEDISDTEYNKRKEIVTRAFDMYLFPWMTDTTMLYWKAANSEDGAKDYKPGIVYYGLPYTCSNRNYNANKALDKGYYYDSGNGYYLMDNTKFTDRMYPGCDESSFVSMSVWGANSSYSYYNTREIAEANIYTAIEDWNELRPGDLLNKAGSNTVMFLYWANDDHTQMVIIAQSDDKTTVSSSLRDISYYQSRNYTALRLSSLT